MQVSVVQIYLFPQYEFVAQVVEHYTFNVGVLGSIPNGFTYRVVGQWLGRLLWEQDIVEVRVLSTPVSYTNLTRPMILPVICWLIRRQ